jgi:hypothetical protein
MIGKEPRCACGAILMGQNGRRGDELGDTKVGQ